MGLSWLVIGLVLSVIHVCDFFLFFWNSNHFMSDNVYCSLSFKQRWEITVKSLEFIFFAGFISDLDPFRSPKVLRLLPLCKKHTILSLAQLILSNDTNAIILNSTSTGIFPTHSKC